jgi:transcriptional regulator with XRE-family HTH domain
MPHIILNDWIAASGTTRAELAAALETYRSTVTRLCAGTRKPSILMALRIEKATSGVIPITSWGFAGTAPNAGARAIKDWMASEGLSFAQAAGRIDVAIGSLRRWVEVGHEPTPRSIEKLNRHIPEPLTVDSFRG